MNEVVWQRTTGFQQVLKRIQLHLVGQLAEKQEITGFFKSVSILLHKACHNVSYINSTIDKAARAGHGLVVGYRIGLYLADAGQSGQHSSAGNVTQATFHIVFYIQFAIHQAAVCCLGAQTL